MRGRGFVLSSAEVFVGTFRLLLFSKDFVFPRYVLVFNLVLLLVVSSASSRGSVP